MNLLPLIHRNKRPPFMSPLSGKIYKSHHGSEPKVQLATISHVETDRSRRGTLRMSTIKTEHKLTMSYMQSELKSERGKVMSERGSKLYKTIDATATEQEIHHPKPKPLKISTFQRFIYPQVQIIPLYLISSHSDIKTTTLALTLEQYFRLLIHKQIDHNCKELVNILIENMHKMRDLGVLDKAILQPKWPDQFFGIKTTDELLCELRKYVGGSQYFTRFLLTLLHLYCVPNNRVRTGCVDNLILVATKQLAHKLVIPIETQPLQMILGDGRVVDDFIDILPNTTRLYIAHKGQGKAQLASYRSMVTDYESQTKKKGFVGRLRDRFRLQIVPNKYDQYSINYRPDYLDYQQRRKSSVRKAMQLLQKKKLNKNTKTSLSSPIRQLQRPKSKQSQWKEQNVEDGQSRYQIQNDCYFHINMGSRKLEQQALKDYEHYCQLSRQADPQNKEGQVLLGVLEKDHEVLKQLSINQFYIAKIKKIFEIVLNKDLPQYHGAYSLPWRYFLEFWVLTSKHLQKLVQLPDCYQLLRNFVECYLDIKDEDYFRDELTTKLYCCLQGDSEGLELMQEVIWSWLCQNGFVEHKAIQRQMLWNFPSRSKTFYLLIASIILGTFKTTPLDLAHQLLL